MYMGVCICVSVSSLRVHTLEGQRGRWSSLNTGFSSLFYQKLLLSREKAPPDHSIILLLLSW